MYEWIQGELGKLGIAISGTCVTNIHHPQSLRMCLASVVLLVARPSWQCFHGLEARTT